MKRSNAPQLCEPTFLVYNVDHEVQSEDDEPPLESDSSVVDVANQVAEALEGCGRKVERLELRDSTRPLAALCGPRRNAVFFNLVESLGRDASREREVPALLASLGVAFTGNDAPTLSLALDKGRVRRRLEELDIPVPRGHVVRNAPDAVAYATRRMLRFPLFVKPARLDASIAISQASLVHDVEQLAHQVDALHRADVTHIVVEEYMPGAECNIAFCPSPKGPITAASCIDFSAFGPELAPIVTYDCKWVEGSAEYSARSVPAEDLLDGPTIAAATRVARAAVRAIGAVGPARVDLRLDAHGQPRVLDVNPNPDLSADAGFALSLRRAGLEYPAIIEAILDDAILRHRHADPPVRAPRSPRPAAGTRSDTGILPR